MNSNTPATPSTVLSKSILPAMGFAAVAAFSFLLACVMLLLRPDALSGDPVRGSVLALTHLVTLGWIASMLFAGVYLLAPLLAGSPLWSTRLPHFHLACHVIGLALLLGGFIVLRYEIVSIGAVVLCIGLLALIVNLVITANKRSLWTPANVGFQAAMFWLAMAGGLALFMLRARLTQQGSIAPETLIALHAHYALFGFLAQALLAVSLRVVPELLGLDSVPSWMNRLGWAGWASLNVGLVLLFPMVHMGSHGAILTAGILIAVGVVGFAAQIGGFLFLRAARLTWGAITHATGILLLLLIVAGALWSFPEADENFMTAQRSWMQLYISLALLGPFAFAILGTAEQLVPRLIWRLRFAPWAKYAELPEPSALARTSAGGPMFLSLLMAWIYLFMGQIRAEPNAIRLGAVLMLVAFVWFVVCVSPALLRLALGVTPDDLHKLHAPVDTPTQTPVTKPLA